MSEVRSMSEAVGGAPLASLSRSRTDESRKGYLQYHALVVLAVVLVIAAADSLLVLVNAVSLVADDLAIGLALGAILGVALGFASWRRDTRRIERGLPLYRWSKWTWAAWLIGTFFIIGLIQQPRLWEFGASLVPPANRPGVAWAIAAGIVALSGSIGATRIASIVRYEQTHKTRLVAVFSGSSRLGVDEMRVIAEGPAP